jgi:hypothetical protein
MKLYHGDKIIPGLIVFVVMITFPIWFNLAPGESAYDSAVREIDAANGCIFDTEEMRTSHMQKLSEWRDLVVREEQRYTEDKNGNQVKMSLTSTCMTCHVNTSGNIRPDKAPHCTVCHEYVDVSIYCWDCHIDPIDEAIAKQLEQGKERN